jgi:hypothetical protein
MMATRMRFPPCAFCPEDHGVLGGGVSRGWVYAGDLRGGWGECLGGIAGGDHCLRAFHAGGDAGVFLGAIVWARGRGGGGLKNDRGLWRCGGLSGGRRCEHRAAFDVGSGFLSVLLVLVETALGFFGVATEADGAAAEALDLGQRQIRVGGPTERFNVCSLQLMV